ncbi:MAG: hypothetical protein J7M12_05215 [Candidatus Hydrogenedentes bacterium]|nr:hypothetical protein [Candidatus Hydrogenedentota bacterium]
MKTFMYVAVVCLVAAVCLTADANVWYVDKNNVSGTENGLSWATAFTTIQEAVDAAFESDGGEVWVAEGTYNEDRMSVDEVTEIDTHSLIMREGVELYGGFTGSEQSKSVRDWLANQTIISGVSATGVYADHAVIGADNATLDGFTVTRGMRGLTGENGGGMYNRNVSPVVANCTFADSFAMYGAGMCNENASPTVLNCTFRGNWAYGGGGGMYNEDSSPTVVGCAFVANEARRKADMSTGAGMYNVRSEPTVIECTFSENYAGYGGAMANVESMPRIEHSVFVRNKVETLSSGSGAAMYNISEETFAAPRIINCTFAGNVAETGIFGSDVDTDTIRNVGRSSPTITNCILWNTDNDVEIQNLINGNVKDSLDIPEPAVTYSDVRGGYSGEGNIDVEPMFVDPASDDYRMQPNSPCIGAGAGGTDMGAFTFADVSGDDKVDASDIQYTINAALGLSAPAETDIDGDGSVTATDIQLVINAVLGL